MERDKAAAEHHFQFYLLGPPMITWRGEHFELSRRQARALLFRLAVDLQPVARNELVFLFWPDTEETAARQNLSRLLSYIRKALPKDPFLFTQPGTLRLSPVAVWSDSETLLSLAEREDEAGLEEAAALYRGSYLNGLELTDSPEYESWLREEQQRFERRYLALLGRLICFGSASNGHRSSKKREFYH
jgi:DNA-binding SARP family transcriptional activator